MITGPGTGGRGLGKTGKALRALDYKASQVIRLIIEVQV